MQIRKPLTADREAHVALILEEHAALVQLADKKRQQRITPLLDALEIPRDASVQVEARDASGFAHLVYDAPDIPGMVLPSVPDDDLKQA